VKTQFRNEKDKISITQFFDDVTFFSIITQRFLDAFFIEPDHINETNTAERLEDFEQKAAVAPLITEVSFGSREHLLARVKLNDTQSTISTQHG
jgi:hypothetical protein